MIFLTIEQDLVPKNLQFSPEKIERLVKIFQEFLPEVTGGVEVVFVSEADIRRYNRQYRGLDKVTDVLSFGVENVETAGGQLGDVLICLEQAVRQAGDGDIELELADLLVHGVLHLLGYDHEEPGQAEEMFPLQDKIIAQLL